MCQAAVQSCAYGVHEEIDICTGRGVFECQVSVIQGLQGFSMQNVRSWSPVQRLAGLGAHMVVLLAVLLELAPLLSLLSLVLAAVVGPVS